MTLGSKYYTLLYMYNYQFADHNHPLINSRLSPKAISTLMPTVPQTWRRESWTLSSLLLPSSSGVNLGADVLWPENKWYWQVRKVWFWDTHTRPANGLLYIFKEVSRLHMFPSLSTSTVGSICKDNKNKNGWWLPNSNPGVTSWFKDWV